MPSQIDNIVSVPFTIALIESHVPGLSAWIELWFPERTPPHTLLTFGS